MRKSSRATPSHARAIARRSIEPPSRVLSCVMPSVAGVQVRGSVSVLLAAYLAAAARAGPIVAPSPSIPPGQHLLALRAVLSRLEESPGPDDGKHRQPASAGRNDRQLQGTETPSQHGNPPRAVRRQPACGSSGRNGVEAGQGRRFLLLRPFRSPWHFGTLPEYPSPCASWRPAGSGPPPN